MDNINFKEIDKSKFDYLMMKYFHYYRMADTWIYIKFPPQDSHLNDDLINTVNCILSLSYIKDDYVSRHQIQCAVEGPEDKFHEQLSKIIGYVGSKTYCPQIMTDKVLLQTIADEAWTISGGDTNYSKLEKERYQI